MCPRPPLRSSTKEMEPRLVGGLSTQNSGEALRPDWAEGLSCPGGSQGGAPHLTARCRRRLAGSIKKAVCLPPISLVKLRSGGLGHIKTRRWPGWFCPAFLIGFWLTSRPDLSSVPTQCSGHAVGLVALPARFRASADRTVPFAIVRSGGAALQDLRTGSAAPMPGAVTA